MGDVLVTALVVLAIVAVLASWVTGIALTVDAINWQAEVWKRSGHRRVLWVPQVLGLLCLPVGLVWWGWYLLRVRRHLVAVEREHADVLLRRGRAGRPSEGVDSYTTSTGVRVVLVLAPVIGWVLGALAAGGRSIAGDWFYAVAPLGLVAVSCAVQFVARPRLLVGPDGLVQRGMLNRRSVAWSQVADVRIGRLLLQEVLEIHLVGRRRPWRPVAPRTFGPLGRARIEDEVRDVRRRWLAAMNLSQ